MSVPEPAARRLFFALWLPDPLRRTLADVARHLPLKSGKPVRPANFHITLQFLGQVSAEQEQTLVELAGQIRADGFEVCLDRLGYWRGPRVAWLGVSNISPALTTLVRDLGDAMTVAGLKPDPRPYHPHLTLRRKMYPQELAVTMEPVCWQVDHFVLVHSRTLPGGVSYEPIHDFPLQGQG